MRAPFESKSHESHYRPPVSTGRHRSSDNMTWRDFLPLPNRHSRTRSKARSEICAIDVPSEADLSVPHRTESTLTHV